MYGSTIRESLLWGSTIRDSFLEINNKRFLMAWIHIWESLLWGSTTKESLLWRSANQPASRPASQPARRAGWLVGWLACGRPDGIFGNCGILNMFCIWARSECTKPYALWFCFTFANKSFIFVRFGDRLPPGITNPYIAAPLTNIFIFFVRFGNM